MSFETSTLAFLQTGAGAVGRTIDSKLKEQRVSVKDFGATGDGVTDDTAAITAAMVVANSLGSTLYFPGPGVYLDSATRVLRGPLSSGSGFYGGMIIVGDGQNSVWKYTGSGTHLQYGAGGTVNSIALGDGVNSVVTFANSHGATTGDTLTFSNTTATPDIDGNRVVTVVSDTTLTVPIDVTVAQGAAAGGAKTNTIELWIGLRDLTLLKSGAVGTSVCIDMLANAAYHSFSGVLIKGYQTGIRTDDQNQIRFYNSRIQGCTYGVRGGFGFHLVEFYSSAFNTCDIGLETGYYDARFRGSSPPNDGVTVIGCEFNACRIGAIAGGIGTLISFKECYWEACTKSPIEIGHNPTDFSGNQIEVADLGAFEARNLFIAHNPAVAADRPLIKLYIPSRNTVVQSIIESQLPAGAAIVKSMLVGADVSGLYIQGVRSPAYETFGAVQTARTGYQYGGVIMAKKNSGNNAFLEIEKASSTDYALLRYRDNNTNARWDVGCWGNNSMSWVAVEGGNVNMELNVSTNDLNLNFGNFAAAATKMHNFLTDLTSGLYRIGASNLGIKCGGTKILDIASTGLTVTGVLNASGASTITGDVTANRLLTATGGNVYTSAQFDAVAGTTPLVITGLSVSVAAGRVYKFRAALFVTADTAGGQKYAIGGSGGLTATLIGYNILSIADVSNVVAVASTQTALEAADGLSISTASNFCVIEGLILVGVAGTLEAKFSRNAASGTSSVLVGSSFEVEPWT